MHLVLTTLPVIIHCTSLFYLCIIHNCTKQISGAYVFAYEQLNKSLLQQRRRLPSPLCISVGAQSTLGKDIFARKYMHEKLTKCPKFTWYLPEKFTKFPNFTWYMPEKNNKMPEFYVFWPKNIFPEFWGQEPPSSLPSPTPMLLCNKMLANICWSCVCGLMDQLQCSHHVCMSCCYEVVLCTDGRLLFFFCFYFPSQMYASSQVIGAHRHFSIDGGVGAKSYPLPSTSFTVIFPRFYIQMSHELGELSQ